MAERSTTYEPRRPADGTLYQIVLDHFETFRVAGGVDPRDGEGLPRFVEQEFRDFLQCGWLAGGFARFRCGACGLDRLVPFSCKGRGFCPSCGGRRMAERAAHLVDHVFPDVPVRQWVLSVPHRLRYQLAWDHDLCRAVVAVYVRAVLGWLRRRARGDGVPDGRGGAVAVIQRFGGALNLNLHVHALVLDGVFARNRAGGLGFHPTPRLAALDVAEVLATVEPRVKRLLDRRGLGEGDDDGSAPDPWEDEVAGVGRVGGGLCPGDCGDGAPAGRAHPPCRTMRLRRSRHVSLAAVMPGRTASICTRASSWQPGNGSGSSVCAAMPCVRRCRGDRLSVTGDGQVMLQLRHRWADGTTHLVFDPVEFLGRLAVLVPRPRINLAAIPRRVGPTGDVASGDCSAWDVGRGWRDRRGRGDWRAGRPG